MKLLTNKRLQDIKDWERSKGRDEGAAYSYEYSDERVKQAYHLGQLHGDVEARNRWIIEGCNPPGNTTVQDIERFLREV